MTDITTIPRRPKPNRPRWGWTAWEATVGYIAQHHSPDATLKLEIHPMAHVIGWGATLSWGGQREAVTEMHSFPGALTTLWQKVEQSHDIFKSLDALAKRPADYGDDHWLDEQTYAIFSRLVNATDTVLTGDWQIIMTYRPVDMPDKRHQTRLIAQSGAISRAGRGPTLREACRSLYHNVAPVYQMVTESNHTPK